MLKATKFEMSLEGSTRSKPIAISKVDDPEGQMRSTNALKQSWYHTARASSEMLAQKENIVDA